MRRVDYVGYLTERISNCRDHLTLIDRAFAEELAKPIMKRQPRNLIFLNKERSVYTFAMEELEGALTIIKNDQEK
jgi:hypothetical protein